MSPSSTPVPGTPPWPMSRSRPGPDHRPGETSTSPTSFSRPDARRPASSSRRLARWHVHREEQQSQEERMVAQQFTFDDLKEILVNRVGCPAGDIADDPNTSFEDMGLDSLAF